MLQKWLEKRYPEIMEKYPNASNQRLDEWLSVLYEEVYSEYLEEINPARILAALLLPGTEVSGGWVLENIEHLSLMDFIFFVADKGLEVSFDDNIPLF